MFSFVGLQPSGANSDTSLDLCVKPTALFVVFVLSLLRWCFRNAGFFGLPDDWYKIGRVLACETLLQHGRGLTVLCRLYVDGVPVFIGMFGHTANIHQLVPSRHFECPLRANGLNLG